MKYKHFKCPKCGRVHTAGEWNNETLILCKTPELKRKYVRIQDAGKQEKWYQCPSCKAHINAIDAQPMHVSEIQKTQQNEGGIIDNAS